MLYVTIFRGRLQNGKMFDWCWRCGHWYSWPGRSGDIPSVPPSPSSLWWHTELVQRIRHKWCNGGMLSYDILHINSSIHLISTYRLIGPTTIHSWHLFILFYRNLKSWALQWVIVVFIPIFLSHTVNINKLIDVCTLQKDDCCSTYPISFHYIRPEEMYFLDFFIYRVKVDPLYNSPLVKPTTSLSFLDSHSNYNNLHW